MNKQNKNIQKLNDIGFKVITDYTDETAHIVLERTVEGNKTHRVILEDHRWEKFEKDFDPERDVGDWLIFSFLTDDERDYFGRFIETQYPLSLEEVHLIEKLIKGTTLKEDLSDG